MEKFQHIVSAERRRVAIAFLILVAVIFLIRLWWLQVWQGKYFWEKANNRYLRAVTLKAPRGKILDITGKPLATNEPSFSIVLMPAEFSTDGGDINSVCQLVGIPTSVMNEAVAKIKSNKIPLFEPFRLSVRANFQTVTKVLENSLELHGVTALQEPIRIYPNGNLAAHILGYVGAVSSNELEDRDDLKLFDWTGKLGIEKTYDRYLQGEHGREVLEVDALGEPIRKIRREVAKPGQTLVLTIDLRLQTVAEDELKNKRGAIVALDPKSGSILALASSPTFDPNWFSGGIQSSRWCLLMKNEDHPLQNRAIASAHPPGSTFKLVTAASAVFYKVANLNTKVNCNGGILVGKRFFRCWRKHGKVNLQIAIGQSCDSYFYKIGLAVGPKRLAKIAKKMGLGEKTGIDLPGEIKGILPTPEWKRKRYHERWYGGDTANMSIGQGYVSTTPLQMALVTCAVANFGVIMKPHLLHQRRSIQGKPIKHITPQVFHRIDAPLSLWEAIKQGMLSAVYGKGGTASKLRDLPFSVAGKTGSSQHRKGVKTHSWFIGFAPADDPQIVLSVMVEEAGHGSEVAVPIAKRILVEYAKIRKSQQTQTTYHTYKQPLNYNFAHPPKR